MIKFLRVITLGLSLICPLNAWAGGMFELNVNSDEIELVFEQVAPADSAQITMMAGGAYHADDFFKVYAVLAASGEAFVPGFDAGLGFKPVGGQIDFVGDDQNLIAVGFHGLIKYDFLSQSNVPLIIDANVTVSPKPLSFNDTEQYWDWEATVGFKVIENATLIAGYRYFKAGFDQAPDYSKDSVYVGARLYF